MREEPLCSLQGFKNTKGRGFFELFYSAIQRKINGGVL
jgi:hypothetical protein